MLLDLTPSNENVFGVALLAGRVVGTVIGSTGHITVRADCKAKTGSKWARVPFDKATHVFFAVPSADGDYADKIGTFYPPNSGGKWAGHFFEDRSADPQRVKAARYLIEAICGRNNATHVEKSKHCARCSIELTHPDSIKSNFGPECIKKVGAYMPNGSGTPAAPHVPKVKPDAATVAEREQIFGLDVVIDPNVTNGIHVAPVVDVAEFVPPQPSAVLADSPIVAILKLGDDPKTILATIGSN